MAEQTIDVQVKGEEKKATTIRELASKLHDLRRNWQTELGVPEVVEMMVSFPLFLADVLNMMDLTEEEKREVLGPELYQEVLIFLS